MNGYWLINGIDEFNEWQWNFKEINEGRNFDDQALFVALTMNILWQHKPSWVGTGGTRYPPII